jgi:hypothetical protein
MATDLGGIRTVDGDAGECACGEVEAFGREILHLSS